MNRLAIDSHRSLFCTLFVIFEVLLLGSVVILWCIDHRISTLGNAAGIAFWFSVLGLMVVCWLWRHAAPRLATLGFITVAASFGASAFLLPAIP